MKLLRDSAVSDFLLRNVAIYHNNKILREGRLILFSVKDFYLHFTLQINNTTKHFEIPYPFETTIINNNLILLDYSLSSFKAEYTDLEKRIKHIGVKKKSRYFNTVIRIHAD